MCFFALGESIQSLLLGCPPTVWGIGPVTASEKRLHNDFTACIYPLARYGAKALQGVEGFWLYA